MTHQILPFVGSFTTNKCSRRARTERIGTQGICGCGSALSASRRHFRCQRSDSERLSQVAVGELIAAYNHNVGNLEDLIGERLMFGLSGPRLTDADIRLFHDTRAAGLILYRRNFETPEQHGRLLHDLESALGRRLLVATDHEGGRIVMLGRATTIFPDNLATGTAGDEAFAFRQGLFEARELRRLGVDVNFAPVLDVLTERYSPNIGIRSYGKDPAVVTRYGVARIKGMQKGGLSACAKHFPGKGHSPLDAHLRLPTIDSTWAEMRATHLPPFLAAVEEGIECLMTSHPVYPNLDTTRVPATFSRRIVRDYLRGEVGFAGVIVSDDLEMGAIGETCPIGEAVVKTAAAGHDLLLVCHTEPAQRAAARALVDAYRSGVLATGDLEAAAERVRRLRERRPTRFEGGPPAPEPDAGPLARAIATRSVTVTAPGRPDLRRALNGRVGVVFPRFSDLAPRITIEPEVAAETAYVAEVFGRAGIAPITHLVAIEPTDAEIAGAGALAEASDAMVLFLFDAHLYPSNAKLLAELQTRARALAVVLLRDPYDAALLSAGVLGITAYGFRKCQLDAVVARLLHG
ncbi:MAG: beta-N-acetylhexosaminidase [Candidatus Rokuibacteriota bacterium]|nr:MAG: beta-N-acetylhexosaminidase [Candidatus Rokubacteria bacterium]